ncbi:hypothetical protein Y032_0049g1809 [Ancylostoma ceylanicum]|uniref:Uncharacterized protein n=1 Tax=Ancylostoma ceylanicum TaxID=53326 RepID=A0A016UB49_9BILA|nr:hypothetical protein Y032_0049g1809 [Ancylostoma ceylanicum]
MVLTILLENSKFVGIRRFTLDNFKGKDYVRMVKLDYIKYNHDAVKAWRLLLAYITDEMMVGFERLSRISDRRSSTVSTCPRRT